MGSKTKTDIALRAEQVASALGGEYHAEGPDRDGEYWDHGHGIVGPDGQRLFIAVTTYGHDRGRLTISGGYPPNAFGLVPSAHPKIGVGPTATPERIASEILRRLLPEYTAVLEDYQHRVAEAASAETARDQLAEELATSFPGADVRGPRKGHFSIDMCEELGSLTIDVRVFDGGDRVDVRLDRLTAERARALLAWARDALAICTLPDGMEDAEDSESVPASSGSPRRRCASLCG